MARRASPTDWLPETAQQWSDRFDGLLRFQERYLQRVTTYTTGVADLTQSRSVDPGEWIERYALFLSGVVHDMGDWMLEREGVQAGGPLPLYRVQRRRKRVRKGAPLQILYYMMPVKRGKLRVKEGTTGVPLHVPASAFEGRRGADPKLTLMTDGLLLESGGAPLPRTHMVFVPPVVKRSEPEAELKISDVAGAVSTGSKYRGFVWAKETKQLIAAVEIDVL